MRIAAIGIAMTISFVVVTTTAAPRALGQALTEGAIREAHVKFVPAAASGVLWRQPVRFDGTRFLRLHFTDIVDTSTVGYTVLIRNANNAVVTTYDKAAFAKESSLWTGVIPGDTAVVEVTAPIGMTGLSFQIREVAVWIDAPTPLSIGANKLQEFYEFQQDPLVWKAGRAVAKLSIPVGTSSLKACTGFMVSDDLLLTNQHCVTTQDECKGTSVIFSYEKTQTGMASTTEFRCQSLVIPADYDLDYALLRLNGSPGAAAAFGRLELDPRPAVDGEPLIVVGHPDGRPKQVSRVGCAVTTKEASGRGPGKTDFAHRCDTLPGSSGSPVLDKNGKVIGLHHLGYSFGPWVDQNRAVQIQQVRPKLTPPLP